MVGYHINSLVDIALGVNTQSVDAVSLCELYKVGRAVEENSGLSVVITVGLKLTHHTEALICHNYYLDINAVLDSRGKLHHRHLERTVAAYRNGRALGVSHFCADSGGHGIAHSSHTARSEQSAVLFELIVVAGPYLVLSDVGNDRRVCGHCSGKPQNELLGVNSALWRLNRLILCAVALELLYPLGMLHRLCDIQKLLEHELCVADQRDIRADVLPYLGGVDVDMQYLCSFCKCHRGTYSSVADSCADKEQQVALVDCGISSLYAEASYHSAEQRVVVGECGYTHHSCNNGYLHKL